MAFLLLVFNAADFNLDRFVEEFLVLLAGAGEQERVGDGGVALIDTGDDVRTADPVRLGKIRLRPLRGTIRVRVLPARTIWRTWLPSGAALPSSTPQHSCG